jgi:hypothetical protein
MVTPSPHSGNRLVTGSGTRRAVACFTQCPERPRSAPVTVTVHVQPVDSERVAHARRRLTSADDAARRPTAIGMDARGADGEQSGGR